MNYFQRIAEENIRRLHELEEAKRKAAEDNDRGIRHLLLTDKRKWSEDDYSVRKNRGFVESYNIHTGEILYRYPNCEEFTVIEAWKDIRDEFRGT